MTGRARTEGRTLTPQQAIAYVRSGDLVVFSHACGEPRLLPEALVERAGELSDVRILHMVPMGEAKYCLPEYAASFRHLSLFSGSPTRQAIAEGRADYVPCFFSRIPDLIRSRRVDVAMITVTPPDKNGYCSLGVSVDYTLAAARCARLVIAEVNPGMPRTLGDSFLHESEIDYFVPADLPIYSLDDGALDEVELQIGGHVAELLDDGCCLQLGIGGIPNAVLANLEGFRDLGIHSEMISNGVMGLVEKGVVNGKRKQLHAGKIIVTFMMGSREFYAWVHDNPAIEMHPVDYTNDPFVIAQNENMVSINSALEVDLLGQVAADAMGPRQFSGVGGQVDFVRGACLSRGGKSVIALPSTAKGGSLSRIVPSLKPGTAVTTSRNDVDFVVTEFGAAALRGKSVRERLAALLAIAHPQFRDDLERQARGLYL